MLFGRDGLCVRSGARRDGLPLGKPLCFGRALERIRIACVLNGACIDWFGLRLGAFDYGCSSAYGRVVSRA